jgi:hypothetical protein
MIKTINLLGSRFLLQTDAPGELVVVDAFIDAYASSADQPPSRHFSNIHLSRAALDIQAGGPRRGVHRSKHRQWNFDCVVLGPGHFLWPEKRIAVRFEGAHIGIVGDTGLSDAAFSESVFHVCRSLALYQRPPGLMLHAASWCDSAGDVFAMVGDSGSGKTTCLVNIIESCAALRPHANDRVFIDSADPQRAWSWPSYVSLCEGTMLDHPRLADYARRYEAGLPETTTHWHEALRRSYDKASKRVYPMHALVEAFGKPYCSAGRLAGIAMVSIALDDAGLLAVDGPQACSAQRLAPFVFEGSDPSFLAWHGLADPATASPDLLDGRVPLYRVHAGLGRIADIPAHLGGFT